MFLVNHPKYNVLCNFCVDKAEGQKTKLYKVNVGPYKQTCHCCGKVLVEPQTPAWCELYTKPGQVSQYEPITPDR